MGEEEVRVHHQQVALFLLPALPRFLVPYPHPTEEAHPVTAVQEEDGSVVHQLHARGDKAGDAVSPRIRPLHLHQLVPFLLAETRGVQPPIGRALRPKLLHAEHVR